MIVCLHIHTAQCYTNLIYHNCDGYHKLITLMHTWYLLFILTCTHILRVFFAHKYMYKYIINLLTIKYIAME